MPVTQGRMQAVVTQGCAMCRPRLLATAGAWFLWDFSFYGNKVFQSTFIKVLSPSGSGQWLIALPFAPIVMQPVHL